MAFVEFTQDEIGRALAEEEKVSSTNQDVVIM